MNSLNQESVETDHLLVRKVVVYFNENLIRIHVDCSPTLHRYSYTDCLVCFKFRSKHVRIHNLCNITAMTS